MSDATTSPQGTDLLYGFDAIGAHLGVSSRQAKHRAAVGDLPTFKLGRHVCARRSTLDAWLTECEAKAAAERRA